MGKLVVGQIPEHGIGGRAKEFKDTWLGNPLSERAGAQGYVDDLCALLGVEKPRKSGEYQYEYGAKKSGGGDGFADVWKRGVFGWENKKPGRDLKAALKQLTDYSLALDSPPLLVVSDRERIEIHTAFTGYPDEVTTILLADIDHPDNLTKLRWVFTDPEKLKPKKSTSAITEEAAGKFAEVARSMRDRGLDPHKVAHFLIQCLFCMFAEDERLLPDMVFSKLLSKAHDDPKRAANRLRDLFKAMRKGGDYGDDSIAYFNGGLFNIIEIPELEADELSVLASAAMDMDWRAIEPAIFGTLFERGLNPKKRSQLGAHYTDTATIMRIIEPVILRPLLDEWEQAKSLISELSPKFGYTGKYKEKPNAARKQGMDIFHNFLERLRSFRVLDPACGSGNFLFLALKTLKDIEKQVNLDAERLGLQRQVSIECSPANVMGIEIDPYAAELARVTVWIGELQWMLQNGYEYNKNPILKPLDNIENRDALIDSDGFEAQWPNTDVIVGNPPFLGGSKKRGELGDEYFTTLSDIYGSGEGLVERQYEKLSRQSRVPNGADLVCYWFQKAGEQIQKKSCAVAGLVSTNSIRGGSNRAVLDYICEHGRIFDAWSDEGWINEGAAVRVSLICFDGSVPCNDTQYLNGDSVSCVYPDLTGSIDNSICDLTLAKALESNSSVCFMGSSKKAPFDIEGSLAREWLTMPNPNNRPNSHVVRPLYNAMDIARRSGDRWIIDFGTTMEEVDASLFEVPFDYVVTNVKPERLKNNRESYRKFWWRHAEARPGMRKALLPLPRFIATPAVSKHRTFVWLDAAILPDQAVLAIARADDTTFGILHSRFHELWSLRMCTWMGKGNDPRYTPTTCFETFPFPCGLTPADTQGKATISTEGYWLPNVVTAHMLQAEAIAKAAAKINELRNNWLNPSEWVDWVRTPAEAAAGFPLRPVAKAGKEAELKKRTLTNLYNASPSWLNSAHAALNQAVAAAYGWADYSSEMQDDEILRRLLTLNRERAN